MTTTITNYLQKLHQSIDEIKISLNSSGVVPPIIQQLNLKDFEIQLSAYLSNKNRVVKIPLFPLELNNPDYLDRVLQELDYDLSTLHLHDVDKVNSHIARNLPNLPPLLEALENRKRLIKEETDLADKKRELDISISEQTTLWIQKLEQFFEDSVRALPPEEQTVVKTKLNGYAAGVVQNLTNLEPEIVKSQMKERTEEALKDIQKNQPAFSLSDPLKKADQVINTLSPDVQDMASKNRLNNSEILVNQADKAWEETKIGITSTVGHLLSPTELNYLTANIACEMTRPENTGLSGSLLQEKLEKVVRQQLLTTPYVGIYVLSKTNQDLIVHQLIQNSFPAIETLHNQFIPLANQLPAEKHNLVWSNFAIQATMADKSSLPYSLDSTREAIRFAKTLPPELPKYPITAYDLYSASGAPFSSLIAMLRPDFAEKTLKHTLLEGPFKAAINIIPGRLSSDYVRYLLMADKQAFEYLKQRALIDQMALLGKDKLTTGDFYDLREAESTLDFIAFLEKEKKGLLGKGITALKAYNWVFHPFQALQMLVLNKTIRSTGVGGVVASLGVQLLPIIITNPSAASAVISYFFKSMGTYAVKAAFAKTGLWTVAREGPFKRYVFAPTYKLKLAIRRAIYTKLTSRLTGAFAKKILGLVLGFGTGPIGIALALFGDKFKKLIGGAIAALGIWLYGLFGTYAIPMMLALTFGGVGLLFGGGVGFLIGSGIGAAVGFITVFVLNGFSFPLFGSVGGAASAFSTAGAGAGAMVIPAPALTTGILPFLPVITIAGVGALSVYTIMVTSSAFFAPSGLPEIIGSKYIQITKKAYIAGLENSSSTHFENVIAQNGEKVIYEVSVSALGATLKNVVIEDKTSITRKNEKDQIETTEIKKYEVNQTGQNIYNITNKEAPPSWNINEIPPENSTLALYGFTLNKNHTDSFVTNTVTVTADVDGEKDKQIKKISLSFSIGNPPFPVANKAREMVEALNKCYGSKVNSTSFKDNGNCVSDLFNENTLSILRDTIRGSGSLQCGAFVYMVLSESGLPALEGKLFSKDYFGYSDKNYSWYANNKIVGDIRIGFDQIQPGDIFISALGTTGHAAIVVSRNDNSFTLAEALGDNANDGLTQLSPIPHTITEYLKSDYDDSLGFIRYNP